MKHNSVPVLYYHSVADHNKIRPWSFLSCDIKSFTLQMNYLKKRGYQTCNWKELDEHIHGTKQLSPKTVMIQFDDGFLDNWTIVFPIMKKLGFKFSIVVTPEFIEKREPKKFSKRTDEKNIFDWWGYLSEEELTLMEESEIVEIQAHGYSHTWYESSDILTDVYNGTQLEPWIFWNNNKKEKATWLTNNSLERIPLGYPIFENEKSLSNTRRFIPNDDFINECIVSYDEKKSKEINKKNIEQIYDKYKNKNQLGRYETEAETEARFKQELLGTKEYLENLLEKKIEYLVWPGGGNNKRVQDLAFSYDYRMISKGSDLNSYNSHNDKIFRVAGCYEFKQSIFRPLLNTIFLQLQIWRANGNDVINVIVMSIKKLRKYLRG